MKGDDEELALTLNGEKRRLKQLDFRTAMKAVGIPEKVIDNLFTKYRSPITASTDLIDQSFLSQEMKEEYRALILSKAKQIELIPNGG